MQKPRILNTLRTSAVALALSVSVVTPASVLVLTPSQASAKGPGRGLTEQFEIDYLEFIIGHHYSALRMTEYVVGTQTTFGAEISPDDGVQPAPGGFPATPAKGTLPELKELARRNNHMQREEILAAQGFLKKYYNIDFQPSYMPEDLEVFKALEAAPAGDEFNKAFMRYFSRHHFIASKRSVNCLVASELKHKDIERYCRNIVNSQISDIDEMRNLLCDNYKICDYQPVGDLNGQDSDGNR